MQKIIFFFLLIFTAGHAQSKSTGVVSLNADMTAKLTLDNPSSKVTLVVTGPVDKWSSLSLGTSSSTTSGDVYVYTASVTTNINMSSAPTEQWKTISNTVAAGKRTVTLERTLTNSDLNDFQLGFDATNSIDLVWSLSGAAIATAPNPNRGSTTATFTTNLGVEEVAFDDKVILYPNPSSSEVFIKTKTNLSRVTIYSQAGALVKTVKINDNGLEAKVNVTDLPKALYIFELENETEKSWKQVLVN
ncbi:T9SS type A sorting domain-containing protein [Flavobacterium nackdongense]|uniref:T9SS type A sorting domain-containing protein n=1 Tax=Flavobacterium nackdongense TaxID=2547394 RepID=A0A4P6YBE4_9FLAO|nr:T9SS type A sorting domain-containing protein [Flavobacterium nackdongense]QBN20379.1 T9SS type A sorting domain-containing protein [Flavobacterium nackdongense]